MESIKKLADMFAEFPTIGQRTANRFVFYLIRQPKEKVEKLTEAILNLKKNIKRCNFCFNPFEISNEQDSFCEICKNPTRDKTLLCVVEKESDLIAIENTKKYKGLYFIIGESAGFFKKNGDFLTKIDELKERVKNYNKFFADKNGFSEIIIAVNPTPEGKTASIFIEKSLKEICLSHNFKITHLAKGIPAGGELEYADEETLESAFEGRK